VFGIFKKTVEVVAPISGKVANLAAVPDPVFADKVVGDGVAIDEINSDIACAPVDGIVSLVFPTNHAFVITTKNDIEVRRAGDSL
jgi:sugar PTS system EIIA component